MFADIERLTNILVEKELTPNQFYLCVLLKNGHPLGYAMLLKYIDQVKPFTSDELTDLMDKGYIEMIGNVDRADNYEITDRFATEFFNDDPEACANEFWDAYPNVGSVDGKKFLYRGRVDKSEWIEKYKTHIGWSRDLHRQNMAALDWAKRNRGIPGKIDLWIEGWRDLVKEHQDSVTQFDDEEIVV